LDKLILICHLTLAWVIPWIKPLGTMGYFHLWSQVGNNEKPGVSRLVGWLDLWGWWRHRDLSCRYSQI